MSIKNSTFTVNGYTWMGIILSMFGITAINLIFKTIYGDQLVDGKMIIKELLILGMVGFLLFFIIPGEKLNLDSIGLHNRNWKNSIILSAVIFIVCVAAMLGCVEFSKLMGWKFGESKSFDLLSKPVIALITVRAGIAEEIFMRGFLLERFTSITGKKWIAFLMSTIPFGLLHYPQGYAGILISTVAGGIFALFYFWKKDLKSNIIAHFLIDFIPNVLLV
jgi:membrane protease YdiL (CAAX protease family)